VRLVIGSLLSGLVGLCLWAGTIHAQNPIDVTVKKTNAASRESKTRTRAVSKPVDARTRAAALKFAREHHPELANLLQVLRKADAQNYKAAISELALHSERLARLAERKDERYPVSLDLWKLDSRIRLAVARLTMAGDDEIDAKIRPLLVERSGLRLSLLQLEAKRQTTRLQKLEEQIATLSTDSDDRIAAEIERIRKSIVGRTRRSKTNRTKPTSKETVRQKSPRTPQKQPAP
jgi:hypothetical protein